MLHLIIFSNALYSTNWIRINISPFTQIFKKTIESKNEFVKLNEQEVQEVASQEEAVALDPNQDQNIETIDPANAVDKNSGA